MEVEWSLEAHRVGWRAMGERERKARIGSVWLPRRMRTVMAFIMSEECTVGRVNL